VLFRSIDAKAFYERFKSKVKKLSMQQIIQSLSSLKLNLHLSGQLLDFFSRTFSKQARFSSDDLESLKSQSFIWTTQERATSMEITDDKTTAKGFFLHPNIAVSLPLALPFSLIHRELATEQRLAWLKQRGMTELTAQDIVTFYKNNLQHKTLMDKAKNLEIIRLLFHLFCLGKANERMLRSLQGIQLLSNQEEPCDSDLMYLPHTFKPIFNLEHYIPYKNPHDIFVNVLYRKHEESQTNLTDKWKTFFLALGVHQKCQLVQEQNMTVGELRTIPFAFIEPYLTSIFEGPEETRPAKRPPKDKDNVSPFMGFPYIQFIANYVAFRQFFWEKLKKKENKILKDYASTTYHALNCPQGKKTQKYTYLQYVFQKQALIPNSLDQLKTTSELFAPSISQTIAAFQSSSIASIPVALSPAMEKFLGFKMILSLNDCWEFLGRLQEKYHHASYRLVMSHLLEHIKKEKPPAKQWEFQACNGEWFSPDQLQLWAIPHSSPPLDSPDWIKPILADQDMEAFCSIFKIAKYTEYANPHQGKKCEEFTAFRIALEDKLPLIAFRLAHHQNTKDRPKEVIQRLIQRLDQLNIYRTTLNEDDPTPSEGPAVILEENCLYIEENWQWHIDALAEALGKYLELASDEVKAIKEGLKESRLFRHHDPFKNALTEYRQQQAQNAQVKQPKETHEVPHSPPPRQKEEGKREDEGPQGMNTPPRNPPQTPWRPQVSPLEPNSSPIQDASSSPPLSPKHSPRSQSSHDRKGRKPKQRNLDKEFDAHAQDDKKAKGNWAEEHVFNKLIQTKYREKNGIPEIQESDLGVKTLVFKNRQIEFKWHNDPALKPNDWEEKEGEREWDSGKPFDIEITKKGKKEVKKKWIEVKGTPESYPHFFLSANQWRHYRKNQNDYRLYVVVKAGTAQAEMKKYKKLEAHLLNGTLKPISDLHLRGVRRAPVNEGVMKK
jgi:hypothetical protein